MTMQFGCHCKRRFDHDPSSITGFQMSARAYYLQCIASMGKTFSPAEWKPRGRWGWENNPTPYTRKWYERRNGRDCICVAWMPKVVRFVLTKLRGSFSCRKGMIGIWFHRICHARPCIPDDMEMDHDWDCKFDSLSSLSSHSSLTTIFGCRWSSIKSPWESGRGEKKGNRHKRSRTAGRLLLFLAK